MDNDKVLHSLQKICRRFENKEEYVFKSCNNSFSNKDPNTRKWLVIMKKVPGVTLTNESRKDVSDRRYAKFRANKLLVIAIINMRQPTLRRKFIRNCFIKFNFGYHSKTTEVKMEEIRYLKYEVGKIVECHEFESDNEIVCGGGIHYFKSLLPAYYYDIIIKNGKVLSWFDNGQKELEGKRINEKREGTWIKWNDSSEKKSVEHYASGVLNGIATIFHKNGTISEEGLYIDDEKEGIWTEWYDNKKKKAECYYKNGKRHGEFIKFYSNGVVYRKGVYENGSKVGVWIIQSRFRTKICGTLFK